MTGPTRPEIEEALVHLHRLLMARATALEALRTVRDWDPLKPKENWVEEKLNAMHDQRRAIASLKKAQRLLVTRLAVVSAAPAEDEYLLRAPQCL